MTWFGLGPPPSTASSHPLYYYFPLNCSRKFYEGIWSAPRYTHFACSTWSSCRSSPSGLKSVQTFPCFDFSASSWCSTQRRQDRKYRTICQRWAWLGQRSPIGSPCRINTLVWSNWMISNNFSLVHRLISTLHSSCPPLPWRWSSLGTSTQGPLPPSVCCMWAVLPRIAPSQATCVSHQFYPSSSTKERSECFRASSYLNLRLYCIFQARQASPNAIAFRHLLCLSSPWFLPSLI